MAKTLDRDRDYATTYGEGEGRYHQDNLWFDGEGKLLPGQKGSRAKDPEHAAPRVFEASVDSGAIASGDVT
jgi:hypothetical protein